MRLGVLSDIHSNIYALEAALRHGESHEVECWVNLGDILYGPIEPKLTYDCLQTINALTVSGNEDREIYEASPKDRLTNTTVDFVCRNLGEKPIAWMRSLPSHAIVSSEIYLCHGNPEDDTIYLLEEVSSGGPVVREDSAIKAQLRSISQPLILCGHTHIPRTVMVKDGQTIVNPGSVGLPAYRDIFPTPHAMQTYSPHARYAIIEVEKEHINVQHCRVAYDWERAAKAADSNGRVDWGSALRTGRVPAEKS